MRKRRLCGAAAILCALLFLLFALRPFADAAVYRTGSSGEGVKALQTALTEQGFDTGGIDGVFGSRTKKAVLAFQKARGLTQDGVAGPLTLKALGLSDGGGSQQDDNTVYLLARVISAEARGEPYSGQVAVGAVILNRVKHPSFPNTVAGV
ncbi:MAG TPA: peptidoglycan-binding protein, partial [Oscillospiraceae bacterium]|nr:peptidoglycan-binding protein [Oscillospiraceae bacterium]